MFDYIRNKKIFINFTILISILTFNSCATKESVAIKSETNSDVVKYNSSSNGKTGKNLSEIELNLPVVKKVLPNGLTILLVENHHLPIFSYYTFYKVGAVYEDKGITGAAHFLEHLMFKGTKKYPPGSFDQLIEGNGGNTNAYTTLDLTVYHENIPTKIMEKMIEVEADRMQNLLLDPEAFEKERNVILEERKLRYENSPKGQLFQRLLEEVFVKTPYGGSVIGSIPDLKSVTRDQIYAFFKAFYAPNNAILVMAGDFKANEVIPLIEKHYGIIPSSQKIIPIIAEKSNPKFFEHQGEYNRELKIKGESPEPIFAYAFPSVKIGERKSYVLDLLASILAGGESSYLVQKLVKSEKPLLQDIGVSNYTLKNSGVFFVSGDLLKGKNVSAVKKELSSLLKKSCKEVITEREILKIKNQHMIHVFRSLETNAGLANFVGQNEVYFNDYSFYKKEFEIVESITPSEVQNQCNELFNHKHEGLFISVWNKYAK